MSTTVHAPHEATYAPFKIATSSQVSYLEDLLTDHQLYEGDFGRLWKMLEAHRIDEREPGDGTPMERGHTSQIIDWVKGYITHHNVSSQKTQARQDAGRNDRREQQPAETVGLGVYRKDGVIYVVQPSKSHPDRCYAKKIVEGPKRFTESGEVVDFEFEYDRGAIWRLTPADRMTLEEAKHYMLRYGRCLRCGRTLKAGQTMKTVEQTGVAAGPVCRKYFS